MCNVRIENRFFCVVVIFLLLTMVLPPSIGAGENLRPNVVLTNNIPVLVLPEALKEFIKKELPDYRVPTKEDMTGDWATYSKKDAVPYASWGDFNGDGLTDMVLMMLRVKKEEGWVLAAFHQTADNTYKADRGTKGRKLYGILGFYGDDDDWYRGHPPQQFHVYTVKAGQTFKVASDKLVGSETPYKFDIIVMVLLRDPLSGYYAYWKDIPGTETRPFPGMYHDDDFGALEVSD